MCVCDVGMCRQVLSGDALTSILGSNPDRVPDLFVVPQEGTLYSLSKTKVSDHGGCVPSSLPSALKILPVIHLNMHS